MVAYKPGFVTVQHVISISPEDQRVPCIVGKLDHEMIERLMPFKSTDNDKEVNKIFVSGNPFFNQDLLESLTNLGFNQDQFLLYN